MHLLSEASERELLHIVDQRIGQYIERLTENLDTFDLISRAEVKKRLGVSNTTLRSWEDLGLKRYQPPLGKTNRVYYRKTDIYKFLEN